MSTTTETITIDLTVGGLNGTFQVNATLDTGYLGPVATLAIPEIYAYTFGLVNTGLVYNYTTANGQNMPMNLYIGNVTFDGTKRILFINVSPELNGILVGLEFLRIFERQLAILKKDPY